MPSTDLYTIEWLRGDDFTPELEAWAYTQAELVAKTLNENFDWKKFNLKAYADRNRITLCRRAGIPAGFLLARLFESIFDGKTRILYQDLLFCQPGTRAAKLLLEDFIAFGRKHANHVLTMTSEKTNIKGRSLEKLGFQKLETVYRLEI